MTREPGPVTRFPVYGSRITVHEKISMTTRRFGNARVFAVLLIALVMSGGCGRRSHVIVEAHRDVKSFNMRGNELFYRGDYPGAARNYDRARLLARRIDDRPGEAESINNLGQLYLVAKDYDAAKEKFNQAYAINQEIGNRRGMAANLNNLGSVYIELGDFDSAMQVLDEARKISRQEHDSLSEAVAINNMGLAALESGDLKLAESRFLRALRRALDLKRHRLAAACLQNLGRLRERQGDMELALHDYRRALREDRLVEYSVGIAVDLAHISGALASLGRLEEAKENLERALFINTELGFRNKMRANLMGLIALSRRMGDNKGVKNYRAQLKRLERR